MLAYLTVVTAPFTVIVVSKTSYVHGFVTASQLLIFPSAAYCVTDNDIPSINS